jgi:hypothetical protein
MADTSITFNNGNQIEVKTIVTTQAVAENPIPRKSQANVEQFWDSLISKSPNKVYQIFPDSLYEHILPPASSLGQTTIEHADEGYERAVAACKEKMQRIVKECYRSNEKYTDPDFDLEKNKVNCYLGLDTSNPGDPPAEDEDPSPQSIHRVDYIFDKPQFLIDGYSTSDIHQGNLGDCWWVAAVANVCSMPHLMEKVCVAQNAECGVYGFAFFRDGEWISTVVDDNLPLR